MTICSCVGRLRWTNVSHAPHFRFFHHNLSRILKEEFSKMKSWYVFTIFFPLLFCFIMFFLCLLFCVFFFVLFCFVFFCLVWVLFGVVVFFFCCFACLVLFLFCFVLFNLFRLLVFCLFFFFYRHRCLFIDTIQIEIMYNPANSICHGTCETDREFEWLNEWKLL